MTLKKLIGKLHLFLGLVSGVVIFVVSITGAILAFEQEIKQFTEPYRFVKEGSEGKLLAPSVLVKEAEKALPGKKANGILYGTSQRNAEVGFYNADPEYYYVVFVDPYNAKVRHVWNEDDDFFHFILHGHYYFWLPTEIGQMVIATSCLIFVVMMVTGLILWWPKNKSAAKQRFSIKWNAKWRRRNYDLHNVLGFYVMSIGVILALTGLVWGFQWFSQGLYTVTGGEGSDAYVIPPSDTLAKAAVSSPIEAVDRVWNDLRREYPVQEGMNISIPHLRSESIYSYVNFRAGTYYHVDYNYFDQHTLKRIPISGPYTGKYNEASFANLLRRMNYDIHVGAILGLPGKILAFLASLVCASLPVTGITIWWGRARKKKPVKKSYKSMNLDPIIRS